MTLGARDKTFKSLTSLPISYYPMVINNVIQTIRVTVLLVGKMYKKQIQTFPFIKPIRSKEVQTMDYIV